MFSAPWLAVVAIQSLKEKAVGGAGGDLTLLSAAILLSCQAEHQLGEAWLHLATTYSSCLTDSPKRLFPLLKYLSRSINSVSNYQRMSFFALFETTRSQWLTALEQILITAEPHCIYRHDDPLTHNSSHSLTWVVWVCEAGGETAVVKMCRWRVVQ